MTARAPTTTNLAARASADIPVSNLRAHLNGKVIARDDPGYDDARGVFFTGFDRRPAAIVRVADASDVSRVINVARETGAELAVPQRRPRPRRTRYLRGRDRPRPLRDECG
jgi:hypothetical protein